LATRFFYLDWGEDSFLLLFTIEVEGKFFIMRFRGGSAVALIFGVQLKIK